MAETETWLLEHGVYQRPVIHRKQVVDFIMGLGLEGGRVKRLLIEPSIITVTYFYKEGTADKPTYILSPDHEGPLVYEAVFAILPDEGESEGNEFEDTDD